MKAIRIHEFGQTEDVLKYKDVPVPEPKAGEVLIKVEAASLNRADLGLRKGTYRIAADALPVIPGREFAGTIAKLGAGVNEFTVGQRVGWLSESRRLCGIRHRENIRSPARPRRSHIGAGRSAATAIAHRVVRFAHRRRFESR